MRILRASEREWPILTAGPLDVVAGARGNASLLRETQEKLRASEGAQRHAADMQAAILNALPADVALIDPDGVILSVNDSWRRAAAANSLHGPDSGVGQNYLEICERANGDCAAEAQAAAIGIRRVLRGETAEFAIDYPCHSPTEQRWFHLKVTAVSHDQLAGAVVMHVNVTERKQAEESAQWSQKRLRDLIDGLGPSMFVGLMTPQGILIEANRPALAAAGLKPEDVLGKPFEDTYWWTYSGEVQQQLREAIALGARGQGSRYDVQVRAANDQFIDVDFCLQPLCDDTGAVAFLVPSASVNTKRKQMEHALRESHEKFNHLADHITDAFWIRSPDMRTVHYVSPAFERIWGRSTASLYAHPHEWADFTVPEDRARVLEVFDALTKDSPSLDIEYRIVRPDGEIRRIRVRGFQVRDATHKLIRLTGIVTDITDRQRAADALRTSLEEFRTLAEAMPQIVWMARPDGKNVYFNQRWADYTGLALEEGHGDGWGTTLHPDDQQRVWHAWQHATATIGTYSLECRLRRADGVYRWWLIRGMPLRDAADDVLKWFGTCTDIHDLKLAELEISRTNRALHLEIVERKRAEAAADGANRSKSEFLANMSHEIRTPLNGIVGMAELALGTNLSLEQREYLDMLRSSGQSLLTVINEILDFSKIEAGRLTIDVTPFDLSDCLATTLKLLATQARQKGLQLVCDIGPHVPTAVMGDPGRLSQIVTNLVGNAIKFTEHGEVVLSVDAETPTGGHAMLRFSVSDRGIGVALEQQELIFKPFIQADGSTTRKYGGTGLGLAISASLVALLGGRIWLESETGKGSTFHFTMPVDLQQTPAPQSKAADIPVRPDAVTRRPLREGRRTLRILLAEDNKVNQLVAARLLEKRGHTVIVAGDGREALAVLDEAGAGGFDLILMDVQMPEMDGLEATGIIRAREKSSGLHIPIIAMTAHAMKGDEARCLAAGMDAYSSKPIQVEQLFATIDRFLS